VQWSCSVEWSCSGAACSGAAWSGVEFYDKPFFYHCFTSIVNSTLGRVTIPKKPPCQGQGTLGQGYSPRVRVKAPLVRVTAPVSGSRHPWSGLQPPCQGQSTLGQGYSPRVRVKAPLVRVTAPVSGSKHPGQGYSHMHAGWVQGCEFSKPSIFLCTPHYVFPKNRDHSRTSSCCAGMN
jgi:hypothetical protein